MQCRRNPSAVSEESEKAAVITPHNAVDGLTLAYFSQCISAKEIKPLRGAARMYGHTVERTRGLVGIAGLQTGESQPEFGGCPLIFINGGRSRQVEEPLIRTHRAVCIAGFIERPPEQIQSDAVVMNLKRGHRLEQIPRLLPRTPSAFGPCRKHAVGIRYAVDRRRKIGRAHV